MGLTDVMHEAVQSGITNLILTKGYPVLPNGQINETLVQHGYAYSAWKDSVAENHLKGGMRINHEHRRWEEVPHCELNTQDFFVTKDDLETDHKGNVTLEAEGLSCICGQYTSMKVRYIAPLEKIVKDLNIFTLKTVLAGQKESVTA